jgi:glycosyltransferase involved in cell wall biosynthesis/thioredoxin-like negative regulator of GroEL
MNKSGKDGSTTIDPAGALACDSADAAVHEAVQPEETGKLKDPDGALASAREELARLVAASTTVLAAQKAVGRAQELARDHLHDVAVRFMLLQIKETAGSFQNMYEQWSALLADEPDDIRIVRYCASHLIRERRAEEALALIDRCMPETLDDWRAGLARAELLADIRAHVESDSLFSRLIEMHGRRELRIAFCKRLNKRGLLVEAFETIAPIASTLAPESKAGQLAASVAGEYAFYTRFEPDTDFKGQDIKIVALKHAILAFRNRVLPERGANARASIALVTGSLGPGGAERQLTRLACHLQKLSTQNVAGDNRSAVPGASSVGGVEVLVKQYSEAAGASRDQRLDFFVGSLHEAGVGVTEINALPAVSVGHQHIESGDLQRLLEKLPAPVHYGVTRLAPYLRERRFDVVSLWQDGTCLFGALAALLAGVPVIHLVFRGLPPNIRRDRDRPEYAVLYRALAEIPGVQFVSNSRTAAEEYARWLGVPIDRFHVLYNGVPDLNPKGDEQDQRVWQAFASRTQDATETIGGVFRLEPDKRPLLWIKLAARYLKKRPLARFVMVGGGRLQDKASALVAELGLKDRLLFAGLSSHVGFWYSKMNAKVLLSRYEGLPNVLIEAQLGGIATLSTPAGGAGECFVDGVTGHLLESADQPDLGLACDKLAALVDAFNADGRRREHARQRARLLFSVEAMVGRFIELCVPGGFACEDEGSDDRLEDSLEV